MNQNEKDQFRVDHDPAVIAVQKQLDAAKRRLATARAELDNVSAKKEEPHYWEKRGKKLPDQWTAWGNPKAKDHKKIGSYDPNIVKATHPIIFDKPFVNPTGNPSADILIDRWNFWMDNVRKWQVGVYNLEQQLSSLKQQKLKSYADSRAAWDAKNKQMKGPVSGGCFTNDTLVLMESGFKRIADIKAGERVRTVDPSGNHAVNTVRKHFVFTNNHYYLINGNIKVTALHRFSALNGWIRARDLKIGDRIQRSDGSFEEIISKELFSADLTVYNLNIADNHNFFVSSDGKKGYLVHNTGGGGGK